MKEIIENDLGLAVFRLGAGSIWACECTKRGCHGNCSSTSPNEFITKGKHAHWSHSEINPNSHHKLRRLFINVSDLLFILTRQLLWLHFSSFHSLMKFDDANELSTWKGNLINNKESLPENSFPYPWLIGNIWIFIELVAFVVNQLTHISMMPIKKLSHVCQIFTYILTRKMKIEFLKRMTNKLFLMNLEAIHFEIHGNYLVVTHSVNSCTTQD